MRRYHFKPTAIETACIRTIPLLLFFFCVALFITAAKPHRIPKSNSSAEPTATGDWPEAFSNAAHTGNNRFEAQLNRYNVPNLTQLWASPVGLSVLYTSAVVSNGKVYIGSGSNDGDDHIYAFDALTGAPDLVVRDDDGKPYTVRYEAVNAMLLNEFLKEHREVAELKSIVAEQRKQIKALTDGLQKVSTQIEMGRSDPQIVSNP